MRARLLVVAGVGVALVASMLPARASSEVRIVRDQFGVPHVYGATAEDVSYGAGYALASDRLWQMHVFRLIGKGRLSELLGPVVIDIDREIRFFTYTAGERAARYATYPADIRANLEAFRDGINARIAEVRADPTLLPFEFAEFGVGMPADWTVDDSISLEDVLILAFGSGGGNEVAQAALAKRLVERHGAAAGAAMFDDLVLAVDDDGPITIPRGYDYPSRPTLARLAEAQSRRALWPDARTIPSTDDVSIALPPLPAASAAAPRASIGTLEQLALVKDPEKALRDMEFIRRGRDALQRIFTFGSNAQIVGPRWSETYNTAQTGGPQVGYLLPQWLADFGLHSADGKLDATGMTFAGAGPAVLIGRGRGYAWTTTTGGSDLTDTYVEALNPANPREYLYNGSYEPMACRTETYTFRGVPFEEQEICRTRHGPVVSFDTANNQAYALRYAWLNREGQTVEGFFRYNEVTSVQDFATFANYLASNHNMFYTDDRGNFGYWHPGNHPVRAAGVDLRLPQDGSGGSEWQGILPIGDVPHAVNFSRGWLSNWNNQPAEGWERERSYSVVDNAADLERTLDPLRQPVGDPFGGLVNPDRRVDFEDLSANLRYAAFKHHRDTFFRPFLPPDSALSSAPAADAAGVLRGWDGLLTDRDGDGLYHAGKTILDRWVSEMRNAAFGDDLGDDAGWATESTLWHVLSGSADRLAMGFDWLGGEATGAFAARTFEAAVAALAAAYDGTAPESWRQPVSKEHYQRLNADLFTDTALTTAEGEEMTLPVHSSAESGVPGDVGDIIEMDRGTYNHVVVYQTPFVVAGPGVGRAVSKAGSVIPPGQSGHIDLTGREGPHYEDQLALYLEWRYKPMPLSLDEARALAESETTLTRP